MDTPITTRRIVVTGAGSTALAAAMAKQLTGTSPAFCIIDEAVEPMKVGDTVRFVNDEWPEFLGVEGVITRFRAECLGEPAAHLSTGNLFTLKSLRLVPEEAIGPTTEAVAYITSIHGTVPADPVEPEYTGGSVSYYRVRVETPTTEGVDPYDAECNDIIEALQMTYAEGNAFKAIWRMCAARQGLSKRGYTDGLYDAEKVQFFGGRLVAQHQKPEE